MITPAFSFSCAAWPLAATRSRISCGISIGGMSDGLRCGDPVQAGRVGRRRSGSKTSATSALSRVSLSRSASTSASSTSRFSSRMSNASWCATARNFLVSSSILAATSSE